MRILYFGNNRLGWRVLEWLQAQGDEIAGLVVHPPQRRKFGREILLAAGLPPERVLDADRLDCPEVLRTVRDLEPDIGVSIMFGYILRPQLLRLLPCGAVNLHTSLLPYNRGACPNVWSIVDGTPAGVTLHYVDQQVDTGDVVAQQPVAAEPVDTGGSLYDKLEEAGFDLFRNTWPLIRAGHAPRTVQPKCGGTSHRLRDLDAIDEIDLERRYTGRELIDILRARTFAPYPGAFFRAANGRPVHMRLELEYGDESNNCDQRT